MNTVHEENCANYSLRKSSDSLILNPKGYGHLPRSVLFRIFSYFKEDELKRYIIPVCQQWRTVAELPALWKTITFSGKTLKTSFICDKIWQFNEAEKIIIKDIMEPVVVLRQICRCSKNLRYLTLRNCPQINEDSLRNLIFSCVHLEFLDLKGTPFKALIFYEELASAHNLLSINFSGNPFLTTSNITTIILNCKKLNGFHLSTFKPVNKICLNNADCYFILSHTALRLTSLTLDCSTLCTYSFASILRCKNLRYLCLNYAYNFDGNDFQHLWKTIKNLTSMKIRFSHQIDDMAVKNLFEKGAKVMRKLEVLDFTGCSKIGDVGITAVAKCCVQLKTLILRSCKKVTSLELLLKKCPLLETLNVAFCVDLKLNNSPPVEKMKFIYINDCKNLKLLANLMKKQNSEVLVRICESEYNKNILNFNVNKSVENYLFLKP
ncbi:F-box and leucine-rich repeat protein 13-like [Leptinotarsa decemlineata]|uniref:F-box and leucine-rich repeat protein 13-like n=1 Tax=Leptinotarsa decemlineata TaxID=7539 RepID=UPI003D30AFA4